MGWSSAEAGAAIAATMPRAAAVSASIRPPWRILRLFAIHVPFAVHEGGRRSIKRLKSHRDHHLLRPDRGNN
ncbi:hypothetical protein GCM10010339_29530 [Streptomyces alanosinicus]|uniref:Uncharacterized protein n=1 Tax=Streptomyces alanosinicus TaxID=68171 RepID=A0A919D3J5_9ACTN|nr:hypothetical protein GCM10010339_29530 [Streptomyces alanosinicus]